MNTSKLKEALVDLQRQRAVIDEGIATLQRIIALESGLSGSSNGTSGAKATLTVKRGRGTSYVDQATEILGQNGKPMHIKDITEKIGSLRGQSIARPSVESSILRHISSQGEDSLIVKTEPGVFGLRTWLSERRVPVTVFDSE